MGDIRHSGMVAGCVDRDQRGFRVVQNELDGVDAPSRIAFASAAIRASSISAS